METHPLSAAQAGGRKTVNYQCTCCGDNFVSGRSKAEILCGTCIEIRRTLRTFEKRGVSKVELIKRAEKLL